MAGYPFRDDPDPNAVLRGGPFDGERLRIDNWASITLEYSGRTFLYRPTGETDSEYGHLAVYIVVSDHPT